MHPHPAGGPLGIFGLVTRNQMCKSFKFQDPSPSKDTPRPSCQKTVGTSQCHSSQRGKAWETCLSPAGSPG